MVVDINATCTELGPKCVQLMGNWVCMFLMDATLCPTPFNKGKISALNTLQADDFPGLYQVLGEEFRRYGNRSTVLRSLAWSRSSQPRNHDE